MSLTIDVKCLLAKTFSHGNDSSKINKQSILIETFYDRLRTAEIKQSI